MLSTFQNAVRSGAICSLGLIGLTHGQFTYPNCANVADKDFAAVQVIGKIQDKDIEEPLKMDFQRDASGIVDIYFIQRNGAIKFYSGKDKSVKALGTIDSVETGNEDGLVGMALDPDFKVKNRIFVYYSHATGFRISRFDLDPATHGLKPATEKVFLTIKSGRGRWHTSGAMRFDAYGDLWINVGDNESLRMGPANTADLRGGILRIHPKEDGTYSIPEGNMWEYASKYFTGKGKAAVAAAYMDTAQMKREIFVKGTRNAYTLTLDPVRRWATCGDCGPDYMSGSTKDTTLWTEEHNIATSPSYRGWPYFTGYNHRENVFPGSYDEPGEKTPDWKAFVDGMDPNAPTNTLAEAKGVDELLPAVPGTHTYAHACAMTGPIYRYDGALNSPIKFPPHFNRVWFVTDFDRAFIQAIRLNDAGQMVGPAVEVLKGINPSFARPLDFQQGPDGALYYLNHSCGTWHANDACTGIYRIEYKGTCQDPNLRLETPTSIAPSAALRASIDFGLDRVAIRGNGGYNLEVLDVAGKSVYAISGEGEREYAFTRLLQGKRHGLYFVRVANAEGSLSRKFAYFPSSR